MPPKSLSHVGHVYGLHQARAKPTLLLLLTVRLLLYASGCAFHESLLQLITSRHIQHASKLPSIRISGTLNTHVRSDAHLDKKLKADSPPEALDWIGTGPHQRYRP